MVRETGVVPLPARGRGAGPAAVGAPEEGLRIAIVATHGHLAAELPAGAPDTGARAVYVMATARRLAQLGFAVDLWTRRFDALPEAEWVAPGLRIVRVPCGGPEYLPKEWVCEHLAEWGAQAVRRIADAGLRYDLIWSHYWDGGLAARVLASALRCPHVHTPHSLGLTKQRRLAGEPQADAAGAERRCNLARRLREERWNFADSTLITAAHPPMADLLVREYDVGAAKVCVIPAGYDEARFHAVSGEERARLRQHLGFSGSVVVAAGRPARGAGYDLLVDAFGVLARRVPDARLHLALVPASPAAEDRKAIRELQLRVARRPWADRIVVGPLPAEAELPDLYRAADLVALPSRYESFSTAALAAIACATPCVASGHGGLHRVLEYGRHAMFGDPFDPEDFGIAMAKVLRDVHLRSALIAAGEKRARERHSWRGVALAVLAAVARRTGRVLRGRPALGEPAA